MYKHRNYLAALLFAIVALSTNTFANAQAAPITFSSLLDDMTNRELLARWPAPHFSLKQASSYDTLSNNGPGNYDWFANRDWSSFIRSEAVKTAAGVRTEHVMLEELGPGVIVRFWAGGFTDQGQIRIYIDGLPEPVLSGTADELIGGHKYFPEPFAGVRARGRNLYAPIPYAKSVKITYDGPIPETWERTGTTGFWYNINYRTYAPGTEVQSFSLASLSSAKQKMDDVARALVIPPAIAHQSAGILQPKSVFKEQPKVTAGSGAISRLQLKLKADHMEKALRQTVLSLSFDEHTAVEVPVGDFFGSGVGLNAFESRYRRVTNDGTLTAYWIMPYKDRYQVALVNHGDQAVAYELAVENTKWSWDDQSLYFHAQWRREIVDTEKRGDFNYVTVNDSRGVYLGDTLSVFNPVAIWWGEGDEKIFVDHEAFPSHFGTGTEDYYGSAWGMAVFASPFHAEPRVGANHLGFSTATRERILDSIPFWRALKFDMEVWHWRAVKMEYAVATFWYGDPSKTSLDPEQLSVAKDPIVSAGVERR